MTRNLSVAVERWPVAGAFVIARGAKTHVDVVVAEVTDGDLVGRGEATAIYYHGETAESVAQGPRVGTGAIFARNWGVGHRRRHSGPRPPLSRRQPFQPFKVNRFQRSGR